MHNKITSKKINFVQNIVDKIKLKTSSQSLRDTLKLLSGTAGSQLITLSATPILSRIYSPESFGVLATYASMLGFLTVICSLRYEMAIVIPDSDNEGRAIAKASLILVCLTSLVLFISVNLLEFAPLGLGVKVAEHIGILRMLSIGVLCTGTIQVLNYLNIRKRNYGLIAKVKVIQSIAGAVLSISFAFLSNLYGLAISLALSAIPSSLIFLNKSTLISQTSIKRVLNTRNLWQFTDSVWPVIRKYSHVALPNSSAGVLNSSFDAIVSILLASIGDIEYLGYYYFSKKLIDAPASLIGSSIGDVFLGRLGDVKKVEVLDLCKRNVKKLAISSASALIPYTILLTLAGPQVFGTIWNKTTSLYLLFLIPSSIAQISIKSTGMAFITEDLNTNGLYAQTGMLLLRLTPLAICIILRVNGSLLPFSVILGLFLGYLFYGFILFKNLVKNHIEHVRIASL